MRVEILNNRRAGACELACGFDWSDPANLELAAMRLAAGFGDGVSLSYHDLAEAGLPPALARWAAEAKERNFDWPLLLVNDRLRIAGSFDIRRLLDVVEAESEVEV